MKAEKGLKTPLPYMDTASDKKELEQALALHSEGASKGDDDRFKLYAITWVEFLSKAQGKLPEKMLALCLERGLKGGAKFLRLGNAIACIEIEPWTRTAFLVAMVGDKGAWMFRARQALRVLGFRRIAFHGPENHPPVKRYKMRQEFDEREGRWLYIGEI